MTIASTALRVLTWPFPVYYIRRIWIIGLAECVIHDEES